MNLRLPPSATVLALAALLAGIGCQSAEPQGAAHTPDLDKAYGDWRPPPGYPYPVVVPFDITTHGTKVRLPFSVPPRLPLQRLDSRVDIAIRASGMRGPKIDMSSPDTPSMRAFKATQAALDHLRAEPTPIRLQVWRLENGREIPMVLKERVPTAPPPDENRQWVVQTDPVFRHHDYTDLEDWRLVELGLQDLKRYNIDRVIASLDRVPGRYVLEAEVLDNLPDFLDKPDVDPLTFELVISTSKEPAF